MPASDVVDGGHDDEDAVGAPGAGFDDLVAVQHEVLAQHGQSCRGAGGGEMLRRALERGAIRQHRKTRRAAGRVLFREKFGIEILPDQAFRRARLLDLADERELTGGDLCAERIGERPDGRCRPCSRLGGLQRQLGLGGGNFVQLVGGDLLQDVGHAESLRRDRIFRHRFHCFDFRGNAHVLMVCSGGIATLLC